LALAVLLNLPTTPELVAQFSFANQDSHVKINAAIQANPKFGQILPVYPLDPIPPFQNGRITWGLSHQNAHDNQNQVLGIQGQDITAWPENEEQMAAYIQQHFIEHYLAETMLGVT
jgi:hypothetical protein